MSSIARAFTKRTKRIDVSASVPHHDGQNKLLKGSSKRGKISAPIKLLSTTNMLAYNAPDLALATSSSSSSLRSPQDTELPSPNRSIATPATSPDASSHGSVHESSPIEPTSSISYPLGRSATSASSPRPSTSSSADVPTLPKRAISHTKRSHQDMARQRSLRLTSTPTSNIARSDPLMQDAEDILHTEPHPFGRELAQVNEVVEEFGGGYALEEEEMMLQQKGLLKFVVDEYIAEVEDLYVDIFGTEAHVATPDVWV